VGQGWSQARKYRGKTETLKNGSAEIWRLVFRRRRRLLSAVMDSSSSELPVEQSFPISYKSGTVYNRDLAGQGKLIIRPDAFIFQGKSRGAFFSGPDTELLIRPEQIRDVITRGNGIQFVTSAGKTGRAGHPFVFFCDSQIDAETITTLLPATKDKAYAEGKAFYEKLQQLPAPSGAGSVTNLLIAANVVVFVIMGFLGAGWLETASMEPYVRYVANNGGATTAGEWWRLVTAMFVHYGLLHLALNMWALFQTGHFVERLLGRTLFTLAYFASGIMGGLATILWHGDKLWSAGASGAVFGVYGMLLGYLWREKHGMPRSVLRPMMNSTLTFAGYNLFFGAVHPQIDNMAHIGGFIGGILLGWISALPLDREIRGREMPRRFGLAALVSFVVISAGVVAASRSNREAQGQWQLVVEQEKLAAEEKAMTSAMAKAFAAYQANPHDPTLPAWVREHAVPFYEHATAELKQLPLDPKSQPAQQRDRMVQGLQSAIESYHGLLRDIEAGDAKAIQRFKQEDAADQPETKR
jgi:rhomboid protease GluP